MEKRKPGRPKLKNPKVKSYVIALNEEQHALARTQMTQQKRELLRKYLVKLCKSGTT